MPIPRNFFPNSLGAEVGEVQLVDCVLFKSHCGLAASGSAIVNMERGMIYDVMVGGELGRPVLLSLLQDSLARSSIKHLRDELSMSYRVFWPTSVLVGVLMTLYDCLLSRLHDFKLGPRR